MTIAAQKKAWKNHPRQKTWRDYRDLTATAACRTALERGGLLRVKGRWTAGGREFDTATIRKLIEIGDAIQIGTVVVGRSALDAALTRETLAKVRGGAA